MTFQNQVAVVTGAGEGIGFEIARHLAREGAAVLVNDIRGERAEEAARTIREEGGRCEGMEGDVARPEVVRALVEEAASAFGRLDLAVANAGVSIWDDFFEFSPADFDRLFSVNVGGSFFLAQAAARQMRAQFEDGGSGGRILLLSSVTARRAVDTASAYAVTKKGMEVLARNLAVELAPHGIAVNAVGPGATVVPRTVGENPSYAEDWGGVTPAGRPAYPEDIARAALFLLSREAEHITGQTLIVDGAWTDAGCMP